MLSKSRISLIIILLAGSALAGAVIAQDGPPNQPNSSASEESIHQENSKAFAKASGIKSTPPKPMKQAQAIPALPSPVPAKQLPNGASSITESYGNWTVSCRLNDGRKLCTLAQAQGNKQTGQRTFGVELLTPKGGKIDGTILMPFGLKLDAGATTKLDDKDFGQTLHFMTCIPDGCLLPVSFPATAIDALEKGKILSVTSIGVSNGQAVTFSISLDGFPAALKRVTDLGS